jgi:hypothetical protein
MKASLMKSLKDTFSSPESTLHYFCPQAAPRMKGFGIHFGSTLRFGTVACTVSVPSMSCVSFSDRRTGSAYASSSNPISFLLKLYIVCVPCILQGTDSLLLCKHGSQKVVIPHVLTFLTRSLRLLSYLALHLGSRFSLASCTHHICQPAISKS